MAVAGQKVNAMGEREWGAGSRKRLLKWVQSLERVASLV